METTTAQETQRKECPTCKGKKSIGKEIIEEIREISGEWENSKVTDGEIRTPDNTCPTCKGKGFVGK